MIEWTETGGGEVEREKDGEERGTERREADGIGVTMR